MSDHLAHFLQPRLQYTPPDPFWQRTSWWKAKHDVRAPCSGKVATIDVEVGADVMPGQPILTIAT